MRFARYVAGRVAWTVFAGYVVLTLTFLLFAFTPDPNEAFVAWGGGEGAAEAYAAARNYDEPLLQRYATWLLAYATLDLGTTVGGQSVTATILDRAPFTLVYLVPGILLGNFGGVLVGHLAGMLRGSKFDVGVSTLSYVGLGVPAFFLGEFAVATFIFKLSWLRTFYDTRFGLWTADNLVTLILPMAVVAINVLAVQLRYARAETAEFVNADFVKTFRAAGAGFTDLARHVFRNTLLPLVSLFFLETLTVLFVTVYVVELVFRVPGLGNLAFSAIQRRDIALIIATTLIPAYVGLVGNLIQDVAYAYFDPRVAGD